MTTTAVWRVMLQRLVEEGDTVSQASMGAAFKGHTSRELLGFQTRIPMTLPVVLCPHRARGAGFFPFMCAEAAWILSGSNRVSEIVPFARAIATFSDDGALFDGAYGPKWVDQVSWVRRKLLEDTATRQAVMTLWRERPGPSKDVPCTIALQWVLRAGRLHCLATMRSSDAITGWPFDVFTFSMMSAYLAIGLGVELGDLLLTAGSQHVYARDVDDASRSVWQLGNSPVRRDDEALTLAPLNLNELSAPDDLIAHLWAVARRHPEDLIGNWMTETMS